MLSPTVWIHANLGSGFMSCVALCSHGYISTAGSKQIWGWLAGSHRTESHCVIRGRESVTFNDISVHVVCSIGIKLKTKNISFKDILVHVVCSIGIKLKTKNVSFNDILVHIVFIQ